MTEYLGDVLAARCGIWTPEQYRDRLATIAARYNSRPGRTWRNIQDTATMAQVLYNVGGPYDNWRLDTDFYDEGELLWLDVDTTIRMLSNNKKTLNDFVAAFHGLNGNTPPRSRAVHVRGCRRGLECRRRERLGCVPALAP